MAAIVTECVCSDVRAEELNFSVMHISRCVQFAHLPYNTEYVLCEVGDAAERQWIFGCYSMSIFVRHRNSWQDVIRCHSPGEDQSLA